MKIEKGIPLNDSKYKKYPFGEMEVGDSVFFANEPLGTRSNAYSAAKMIAYNRKDGMAFSGRSIDGGVRIWRTS